MKPKVGAGDSSPQRLPNWNGQEGVSPGAKYPQNTTLTKTVPGGNTAGRGSYNMSANAIYLRPSNIASYQRLITSDVA